MNNTFYFAYGSNMNPERIRQRIPHARLVGKATVKGWRLVERQYADAEKAVGHTVEGVVYLLTQSELMTLDRYEGYPDTYACKIVNAHLDEKHSVRAVLYTLTDAKRKEREGKQYPEDYRLICSMGAKARGVRDEFAREGDERHFAGRFAAKGVSRKVEPREEKEGPKHDESWPPMPVLGDGTAKG